MKIGDLVKSPLFTGQYGIIVKETTHREQINGLLAEQTLYTVSWTSGALLHGFRLWELEAIDE